MPRYSLLLFAFGWILACGQRAVAPEPDEVPNTLEAIIADMQGTHEAAPKGVPAQYDWARGPRLGMGNNAGTFRAFIAWGQVYEAAMGHAAVNTRVQIRDIRAYLFSKKTGQWVRVQDSRLVAGAAYREDFVNDVNVRADTRPEPGGSLSVRLVAGYNYHFWPQTGRVSIDPDDVGGVFTTVKARLVVADPAQPDDRPAARYLMSMGGDYWRTLTQAWDQFQSSGDAGIGKFRRITNQWRSYNMTTCTAAQLRQNPPPLD